MKSNIFWSIQSRSKVNHENKQEQREDPSGYFHQLSRIASRMGNISVWSEVQLILVFMTATSIDVGDIHSAPAQVLSTGTPILTLPLTVGADVKPWQQDITVTAIMHLCPAIRLVIIAWPSQGITMIIVFIESGLLTHKSWLWRMLNLRIPSSLRCRWSLRHNQEYCQPGHCIGNTSFLSLNQTNYLAIICSFTSDHS